REQGFCGECGTSIYSAGADESRPFSIRVGTSRQRRELIPKLQIWCRSSLPWVEGIGVIPKADKQPILPR
ncbi:MAG: GFA family protein, partial [Burkholderiales bacterium]